MKGKISYATWEAEFSDSDGDYWYLQIGWDENPDGTMWEEWIPYPMSDADLDECQRQLDLEEGQ